MSSKFRDFDDSCLDALSLIRRHSEGLKVTAFGAIETPGLASSLLNAGSDRLATENAARLLEQWAISRE